MHREKSTACFEHMIAASSSNINDDNVALSVNQEEAPASTHNTASSSVVPQRRGNIPSQWDPFTRKYEVHWKDSLSM